MVSLTEQTGDIALDKTFFRHPAAVAVAAGLRAGEGKSKPRRPRMNTRDFADRDFAD
jgi:hypothetical protein